jgi:hypothetical protein
MSGPARRGRTGRRGVSWVVHAQAAAGAAPIGTPGFDFAAVTYLHQLGFDAGRRLPELFPARELGIALDLADALLPVQLMLVGQGLFDVLGRRWPVATAAREPGAALRGTTGESAHRLRAHLQKGHQ